MKSLWKRALVTGTAGIALAGGVGLATASPAAAAAAAEPNVLQCSTWIENNVAYGKCYNPGTQLHAFSVRAICGWAPTLTRIGYMRRRATPTASVSAAAR